MTESAKLRLLEYSLHFTEKKNCIFDIIELCEIFPSCETVPNAIAWEAQEVMERYTAGKLSFDRLCTLLEILDNRAWIMGRGSRDRQTDFEPGSAN